MHLNDFHNDWITLVDKANTDYQSLTQAERVWFNTERLIAEVDNGGLISLYYNSFADTMDETLQDLELLDAHEVRELLMKMNALFPGSMPSRNSEVRNMLIDSWEDGMHDDLLRKLDARFYELAADLERKLIDYILSNNLVTIKHEQSLQS